MRAHVAVRVKGPHVPSHTLDRSSTQQDEIETASRQLLGKRPAQVLYIPTHPRNKRISVPSFPVQIPRQRGRVDVVRVKRAGETVNKEEEDNEAEEEQEGKDGGEDGEGEGECWFAEGGVEVDHIFSV